MYLKVFNALYGEGGENEVPESELRQHIEDDYYDYEYFSAPLTKTDDDNKSVDLTDEEKADLKETLEKYKTKIESGAMTETTLQRTMRSKHRRTPPTRPASRTKTVCSQATCRTRSSLRLRR